MMRPRDCQNPECEAVNSVDVRSAGVSQCEVCGARHDVKQDVASGMLDIFVELVVDKPEEVPA